MRPASTRRATGAAQPPGHLRQHHAPPLTDASYRQRDNYSPFQPQREFFKQAINNNDQLRQRMAWAWSQFFVIPGTDVGMPYGMIDYQQMPCDEAFEFPHACCKGDAARRDGSHRHGQQPEAANGVEPNENYARELMQPFSPGLTS